MDKSNTYVIIAILITVLMTQPTRITTWNVRGIVRSEQELAHKLNNCDVMFVCETWLSYTTGTILETINSDFHVFSKFDSNVCGNRGSGGVAMFIRNNIWNKVSLIPTRNSERILLVRLQTDNGVMYVIGVHLPSTNVLDCVYLEQLDYVMELYDQYAENGEVVILGDFNADIRIHLPRHTRARRLCRCTEERALISVVPIDDVSKYSFETKNKSTQSLIDCEFHI